MKIVTVIIPCFNVQNTLQKTLDSLAACKEKEEMEIIIVNDGSKDNTEKMAEKFKEQYPDIFIVINKENGGHGSTINRGLDAASGKYFIVLDGDDWIKSDVFDDFINYLKNHEEDLIVTGHFRYDIETETMERCCYEEEGGTCCDVEYLNTRGYRIPMTDICYKTSLLHDIGLHIQEGIFYVDEEYCSIPFINVSTISFFGNAFYVYRIGDVNQSISVLNKVKRITHMKKVFFNIHRQTFKKTMGKSNYVYIKEKLIGISKTILAVYYIHFGNKKEGRREAKKFYAELKILDLEIYNRCKKVNAVLYLANCLLIRKIIWKLYKKVKSEGN